ncbi:DEAD/DEAH box helicase [Patescibacteria group bacterium]|nr:DEAD/DEAH box helicase [Patescibacteria group bacterium]
MSYAVGSLVRVRGREWVVLPESNEELLLLRPIGGTEDEATGIYLPLELVEPAQFALPDPESIGDYRSCRLLRDAVRLGFRSSAGPFRSFARIAVEPRPYQLVPLLMALKLDPVRLLIADDVGIGKTIEACLIARELLDRGEIERLAVLCPPQLAEQWQAEMAAKFFIDAELVLASTATRLERQCRMGESIFERYPFTVVSTDFIKSDRRRQDFLRTCPEFVIVDEAHTCAYSSERRSGRHQRHELVAGLADDPERHLILVTATPHSGKEEAFRSLLSLLNSELDDLPEDLTGPDQAQHRRELAQYFVQRRRGDIRHYMEADTPFPEREHAEDTYMLTTDYRRLFDRVLNYARETVTAPGEERFRQRVRWWSALALLRALASSPAAAAATLRSRAATADAETEEDADEIGRRTVLDLMDDDSMEGIDVTPGGDVGDVARDESANRRRLLDMARAAEALMGENDNKLEKAVEIVKDLLRDGYSPIVFCRFIATVEYVTEELRNRTRGVEVVGVTGSLPPAEREARVAELGATPKRVLVCTDCLSEGINLQDHFDAVVHYDLSWNPTRHEQREGRVDRYGQPRETIKIVTLYGTDNQIDGSVLKVLLRKHRAIRNSLGISVPIPVESSEIIEAIFEGLLFHEDRPATAQVLPGFEEYMAPRQQALFDEWDFVADREKRSRTMFAQEAIKTEDVAQELRAAQDAIGSGVDVADFMWDAVRMHGGVVSENHAFHFDLAEVPRALREAIGNREQFTAKFELPVKDEQLYLSRTHPIVEGMASYVMDSALDPIGNGVARRSGAIRTSKVDTRTTVLLIRLRYHIITRTAEDERQMLAEDVQLVAFEGAPDNATWLDSDWAEELLLADPDENIHADQAATFVQRVIDGFDHIMPYLTEVAERRAEELLDQHKRVRSASRIRGVRYSVEPQLPPDVLGIYVYLPAGRR